MIKLNKKLYSRALLSAEEAKELEMTKLANGLLASLGPVPREDEEIVEYSEEELKKELYASMWKMAFSILSYHDVSKVDIQKLGMVVEELSDNVILEIEKSLHVSGEIGKLEPKVAGQK